MSKTLMKVDKLLTGAYDIITEYSSEAEEAAERGKAGCVALHSKLEELRLHVNESQELLKEAQDLNKRIK